MKKDYEVVIGVDEAGRGPIAGPVAVGVVLVKKENMQNIICAFPNFKDSKKLTENKREKIFRVLEGYKKTGIMDFHVSMSESTTIDKRGIVRAIRQAMARALSDVLPPGGDESEVKVLLDGSLIAPKRFTRQKTIIKGDEKELVIALASIVAKVTRDRKMVRYAKKFPEYGFDQHKGYGTRLHYSKYDTFGSCEIHRRTFLKY